MVTGILLFVLLVGLLMFRRMSGWDMYYDNFSFWACIYCFVATFLCGIFGVISAKIKKQRGVLLATIGFFVCVISIVLFVFAINTGKI